MYAIIDWHYIANTYDCVEETSEFWEYIAPKFANDSHVMFELFNEPINNDGWATNNWLSVRNDMQTWIDIVRSYAPNNIILVGGPLWDQQIGPAATYPVSDPIGGDNIVYVSHIYAGHWRWSSTPKNNVETCNAVHPVLMTEWGFSQSSYYYDTSHRYYGTITDYAEPLMAFLEEHDIGSTAWATSWTWGPKMFDSDWNLLSGEGEMGCFVKDYLYQKRFEDLVWAENPNAPDVPEGLTAVSENGVIDLYWNQNTDADLEGYNVYMAEDSGGDFVRLNSSLLVSEGFTDDTAASGTTYYYVVTAVDSDGYESGYSDECSVTVKGGGIGTLLCEWWDGIDGSSLSGLYASSDYPNNPSEVDYITAAEGPRDRGDFYGTRLRGYLYPPATGDYTFWIASDGVSQLLLSSDGSVENATVIAEVQDYTNYRQWSKYASQESAAITLAAGKKYYIEVVHVENSGTDCLSVAWNGPTLSFRRILDGEYLAPVVYEDYYSDLTGDGNVDVDDLAVFIYLWLEDGCVQTEGLDLNGNCVIDLYELSVLSRNWGL